MIYKVNDLQFLWNSIPMELNNVNKRGMKWQYQV